MKRMNVVVFDLDDTLYKEIDYLKSAYKAISNSLNKKYAIENAYTYMMECYFNGEDVFGMINLHYDLNYPIEDMFVLYRNHIPEISLNKETLELLLSLKQHGSYIGLISDGRSITQRNKIKALGLAEFINENSIIISEEFGSSKPSSKNYEYFESLYPDADYFYIADNPDKDFIAPNSLGWRTICLMDNGLNIHEQNFSLDNSYLPMIKISSLRELMKVL